MSCVENGLKHTVLLDRNGVFRESKDVYAVL